MVWCSGGVGALEPLGGCGVKCDINPLHPQAISFRSSRPRSLPHPQQERPPLPITQWTLAVNLECVRQSLRSPITRAASWFEQTEDQLDTITGHLEHGTARAGSTCDSGEEMENPLLLLPAAAFGGFRTCLPVPACLDLPDKSKPRGFVPLLLSAHYAEAASRMRFECTPAVPEALHLASPRPLASWWGFGRRMPLGVLSRLRYRQAKMRRRPLPCTPWWGYA
ncbi:hypothetical protein B0T14DRAFT_214355 [Immersiella caudata]|uniref:Uncharacterized protein n=1 Tax=Immersiella caudata TaxID=314043 RepID=A0AA39WQL5_9PEZI|nr:hypothetical protein B0T14DRAFT_214355 [Immersiella caudata]